ncbi:MAG: dipeptide ABC transporter ATP-binding protein [Neisseria sp.]|nr:dipeptide ABC transporter ATP-binding protein [Neisseria sp.]
MNIIEIQGLNAFFGDRQVLHNVSLNIPRGAKTAIVGESGSGKTVLAQALMRLNPAVRLEGRIDFAGEDILAAPPRRLRQLRGRRIGMVFQEPMTALNPVMRVGGQIAETLTLHLGLDKKQAGARAVELLRQTGIRDAENKARAYPFELSGGQRQRAMIAMAAAAEPELLIADEPTTALDVAIQAQILELLEETRRRNKGSLLYITHDLNLVRRFADFVIVMRQGRVVEQGGAREVFGRPQHEYTRMLLNAAPERRVSPVAQDAPLVLEAQNLGVAVKEKTGWLGSRMKPLLEDVCLNLKAGETLGVIGESGSGKTTLSKALLRLTGSTGSLKINNADWRPQSRRHIQIVFQDPFGAFNPRQTVFDIAAEGLRVFEPGLSRDDLLNRVTDILHTVGLPADCQGRYPHQLSGGQRQRLAIARAAVIRPDILVLDEPTSALDMQWQRQILELLAGLQRSRRLSMVIVSHDLAVIRALAHRVLVLRHGRVIEQGDCDQVFARPSDPYTRQLVDFHRAAFSDAPPLESPPE